jgi:TatD DNase family protein
MIPLYGAILARLRNMDSLSEIAQIQQQNLYRIFPVLAANSSENSSFNSLKD